MRYIDAEDVEKRIDIVIGSEPKAWDKKALKELKMYVVNAVPTADVRENVKGEWIESMHRVCGEREYKCSNCNKVIWSGAIDGYHFCPNCGAQMM